MKEEVAISTPSAEVTTNASVQIFGPVLSVAKFSTEEEAIALANDTTYGLAAAVHSSEYRSFGQDLKLICAQMIKRNATVSLTPCRQALYVYANRIVVDTFL